MCLYFNSVSNSKVTGSDFFFVFNSLQSFNKAKHMLANAVPACLSVVLWLFL